ncbi:metalloregulator ArsR/SmtB family transcription factor [Pseudomonas sp. PDM22]|uniref:metalloregulator ArsR/SmtB family transcription factor n=1 Tax=Pseudomonas sp. PDM22 TaxID=2769287 RepID=UPI001786A870|nr:metalloregulator ArsR/SmtB family transcription factor [Pseudomonas sp. PDM22]MBD9513672.1 metalloregulator ArsR/SmtB family transcription factor [Pseudomonas sp. PDM22]
MGVLATSLHPLFQCLAVEGRARALLLIAHEGELSVLELMHAMTMMQPQVSRHLAHMVRSDLLIFQRRGTWVHYRLSPSAPTWVQEIIQKTLQSNKVWLHPSLVRLADMQSRPSRASSHSQFALGL